MSANICQRAYCRRSLLDLHDQTSRVADEHDATVRAVAGRQHSVPPPSMLHARAGPEGAGLADGEAEQASGRPQLLKSTRASPPPPPFPRVLSSSGPALADKAAKSPVETPKGSPGVTAVCFSVSVCLCNEGALSFGVLFFCLWFPRFRNAAGRDRVGCTLFARSRSSPPCAVETGRGRRFQGVSSSRKCCRGWG